jgi:hypothetical protein
MVLSVWKRPKKLVAYLIVTGVQDVYGALLLAAEVGCPWTPRSLMYTLRHGSACRQKRYPIRILILHVKVSLFFVTVDDSVFEYCL